ncbi:MAG TPA: hypothetical protein VGJ94_12675 [Syntrophorhabdaceae bacterium]|jgi:hypothetical protein
MKRITRNPSRGIVKIGVSVTEKRDEVVLEAGMDLPGQGNSAPWHLGNG